MFSVVSLLSPVESSILPSEALGAHSLLVRPGVGGCKRFFALFHGGGIGVGGRSDKNRRDYLMKRLSRNWSRPTKDFMVRKRPNNSWISRFCSGFCGGRTGLALNTCNVFVSITR